MPPSGMSSNPDKTLKNPSNRKTDSGELDVFEASRYFSGYTESNGNREERQNWRSRMSLDVPVRPSIPIQHENHHHQSYKHEKQSILTKEKKHKQPSSPAGKIASFLNSLFNQTGSKKKKPKSTMTKTQSVKDYEATSPDLSCGGNRRRRRRSSMSHFQSSAKSLFSSSSSGFRTPPPSSITPIKSYRDFSSYPNQKQVISLNGNMKSPINLQNENHGVFDVSKKNREFVFLDEKLKFIENYHEKQKQIGEKQRMKNDDFDYDSDSSSDLFELKSYELKSGELPVYETTKRDSIKRSVLV